MRALLIASAMLLSATGAQAAEPDMFSGKWVYWPTKNEMTDKVEHMAVLSSVNTEMTTAYGDQPAHALILFLDDVAVVRLEKGLTDCAGDCIISVRFDGGKPISFYAHESRSNMGMLGITDKVKFFKRVATAKEVKIEVPVYRVGKQVFTFNTEGFSPDNFMSDTLPIAQ